MTKVFHIVGRQGTSRTTIAMGLARFYFKPGMQIVLHEQGSTYLFDGARGWFADAAPLRGQEAIDAVAAANFMFRVRGEFDEFDARPGDTVISTRYIAADSMNPPLPAEA